MVVSAADIDAIASQYMLAFDAREKTARDMMRVVERALCAHTRVE